MNKYDILILDIYNIYYRAFFSLEESLVEINNEKVFTNGIKGSLNIIKSYERKYLKEDGTCYFLFDNTNTSMNRSIAFDPSYKEGRKKMPKSFYKGIDYLEFILRNYKDNYYTLREQFTEADDWVQPLIKKLGNKEILLVSTDLDWSRLISKNIHWLNKNDIIDCDLFNEKYGFYPTNSSVCFYKTFYGDVIDNIRPALKQLPFDLFKIIINNYTDIGDFLFDCKKKTIDYLNSWYLRIERDKDIILNNWQLVSFLPIDSMTLERYCLKTKFNKVKLKVMYKSLGFDNSIDRRVMIDKNILSSIISTKFIDR